MFTKKKEKSETYNRVGILFYIFNGNFVTHDSVSNNSMFAARLIGGYTNLMVFGRWLGILRIYRLYVFFDDINGAVSIGIKIKYEAV